MKAHQIFIPLLCLICILLNNDIALADISEEAQRYFDRGTTAVEVAVSSRDFETAAKEFKEAARLAPDWPAAHYNLAMVYDKIGNMAAAVTEFRRYLELEPDASDAKDVKSRINKLEFLLERENEKARFPELLEGTWNGYIAFCNGYRSSIRFFRWGNNKLTVELPINWDAGRNSATGLQKLPVKIEGNTVRFSFSSKTVIPRISTTSCDIAFELTLVEHSVLKGTIYQKGAPSNEITLRKGQ